MLAMAAFLALPTAASAQPEKEVITVDEGSIPNLEAMQKEQPLVDAAQAISALDRERVGLGGIRLQVEKNAIELYWKGDLPDEVRAEIEAQEKAGITVNVGPADYSEAELSDALQQATDSRDRYPGMTLLVPQPDGSGLQGYFTDTKAAQSYTFAVPVTVVEAPEGTVPMSRSADTPPFWGGAVTRVPRGSCTTGFPVIQGTTFGVLSAAHCDPAGGGLFSTPPGLTIGTSRRPVTISDSIVVPTRSAGRAYWGPPGSSFSMHVVAPTPNFPGQWVCTSGAFTGTNCPIVNIFVGGVSFINGVPTLGVTIGVKLFGGLAVGSGDSGGPVVVALSPFNALAAGLISFAIAGSSCPPPAGGVCSGLVGYIDINWVRASQSFTTGAPTGLAP